MLTALFQTMQRDFARVIPWLLPGQTARKPTLPLAWLRQFQSLKDSGLQRVVLPHRPKATFWGVPVDVENYGARAKITYSDGAVKFIALA